MSLIEWACWSLGDINVLEASEDAQPCRAVVIGKHCPQTMPAVTLPKLEHDSKVCLIPARLLRSPGIKRLIAHRNQCASVDGQVHICLTATLWKYSMRLGVHLEHLAEAWELRVVPIDPDLVRRFIGEVEGDARVVRRPAYLNQRFPNQRDRFDLVRSRIEPGGFGVGCLLASTEQGGSGCRGRRGRARRG